MDAKVRGLWLLVECPFCNSPQILRKYVMNNSVSNLLQPRYEDCEECGNGYFVTLIEQEVEL